MFILHLIKRVILALFITLALYLTISLLLMFLTPSFKSHPSQNPKKIWLYHDLAHTEIILQGRDLSAQLKTVLTEAFPSMREGFVAFSYGDARFMAYTPSWSDLDPLLALRALFPDTKGAIRVGHYQALRHDSSVIPVTIDAVTLKRLQHAIFKSFRLQNGKGVLLALPHPHYIRYFKAAHPYNLIYTCNQWTAEVLRSAGLPAPLWAPLAFEVVYPFVK